MYYTDNAVNTTQTSCMHSHLLKRQSKLLDKPIAVLKYVVIKYKHIEVVLARVY